jgi:hypothetical protein
MYHLPVIVPLTRIRSSNSNSSSCFLFDPFTPPPPPPITTVSIIYYHITQLQLQPHMHIESRSLELPLKTQNPRAKKDYTNIHNTCLCECNKYPRLSFFHSLGCFLLNKTTQRSHTQKKHQHT